MSLATRCPHCKTVFQVRETQLKLRSGTVRCGVCQNPFNGIDNLIGRVSSSRTDDPSENPEATDFPVFSGADPVVAGQDHDFLNDQNGACPAGLPQAGFLASTDDEDSSDETFVPPNDVLKDAFDRQLQSLSLDLNDPPDDKVAETALPVVSDAHAAAENNDKKGGFFSPNRQTTDISPETELTAPEKKESAESTQKVELSPLSVLPHNGADHLSPANAAYTVPEELTAPLGQRRKRSRISLTLWSVGTILLGVILYGQFVYHYSAKIVAWWPPAENMVRSTCEVLSCPVRETTLSQPWTIEPGKLAAKGEAGDQFTLHIIVTNNSPSFQLWPSLALEITDTANNVLSRRILEPQEYLPDEYGIVKGLPPSEKAAFELALEFRHDSAINSRITILNHPH